MASRATSSGEEKQCRITSVGCGASVRMRIRSSSASRLWIISGLRALTARSMCQRSAASCTSSEGVVSSCLIQYASRPVSPIATQRSLAAISMRLVLAASSSSSARVGWIAQAAQTLSKLSAASSASSVSASPSPTVQIRSTPACPARATSSAIAARRSCPSCAPLAMVEARWVWESKRAPMLSGRTGVGRFFLDISPTLPVS